jgi:hypothetical protein
MQRAYFDRFSAGLSTGTSEWMPPRDNRPRRASSHSSGAANRNGECDVQMAVQSVAKSVPTENRVVADPSIAATGVSVAALRAPRNHRTVSTIGGRSSMRSDALIDALMLGIATRARDVAFAAKKKRTVHRLWGIVSMLALAQCSCPRLENVADAPKEETA